MITSWYDVFKYSWITSDGMIFYPYEKNGWLYYCFETNPAHHTKWLLLSNNMWMYFNNYKKGGNNPLYQNFVGPIQKPLSPIILKIRQMEQRRQYA